MWDGEAFGREIVIAVTDALERATAPLLTRIAALEQQLASQPTPRDGKDIDPEAVRAMIAEAIAELPAAKDGEPGKDVDPATVLEMVAAAVSAMPIPKDGKDADPELIARLIAEALPEPAEAPALPDIAAMVTEAVAAIPAAQDGKSVSVEDVAPLISREVEKLLSLREGELNPIRQAVSAYLEAFPPKPGQDGAAAPVVARAFKDDAGQLILTLTNGDVIETGLRDGAPGKDGQDGRDGLLPDVIELAWGDDGRTLTGKWVYGDTAMVVEAKGEPAPFCIDRGVYKAEAEYSKGDGVTWGGSFWIAQRTTSDKPETSDAWRLAVKKGRDGKHGDPGKPGEPGKKGDPGPPGRNYN
jgi:hypothetical protein